MLLEICLGKTNSEGKPTGILWDWQVELVNETNCNGYYLAASQNSIFIEMQVPGNSTFLFYLINEEGCFLFLMAANKDLF